MGHVSETGGFTPDTFRYDLLRVNLDGTLKTIFENGAAISNDGNDVYYNLNGIQFPEAEQTKLSQGRIFSVTPQTIGINTSMYHRINSIQVIPPDSLHRLTYHVAKKGGVANYLLHGIDENGQPIFDYLAGHNSPELALRALARKKMINFGIDPTICRPTQAVDEILLGFATQPGGLGEHYQAIDRMREEWKIQKQTADAVEEFIKNGNQ